MQKLNIFGIISDHIKTLRNDGAARDSNVSFVDLAVFFALPAALAAWIAVSGIRFDTEALTFAVTIFAIFVGLLLNIQVLIFTSANRSGPSDRLKLMKEVFSNISFGILLFLTCLLLSVTMFFLPYGCLFEALEFLLIYLSIMSALNLFMILKRIHVVLKTELP